MFKDKCSSIAHSKGNGKRQQANTADHILKTLFMALKKEIFDPHVNLHVSVSALWYNANSRFQIYVYSLHCVLNCGIFMIWRFGKSNCHISACDERTQPQTPRNSNTL